MTLGFLRIATWPLVLKVPVFVAGLMITGAAAISQVVFWQFEEDQRSNLQVLASAYLDGLSASVLPGLVRRDVWEVFEALDRSRGRYPAIEPRFAVVALPDGRVLAASDPQRFPLHSAVPDQLFDTVRGDDGLRVDTGAGRAWLTRTVRSDGFPVGRIFSEVDIAGLVTARRKILLALVAVNGALTLGFALGGYFALKRMLRPLSVLIYHVERIRNGVVDLIPEGYQGRVAQEFRQLFDRFNAMARAVTERQILAAQLAEQEKYAMLGRLASGLAHEINNPLGGMLNAIDTIQAHGNDPAVVEKSLGFLKRGFAGIRNVARAALVTYKGGSETARLNSDDLDDLPFLVQHETGTRRIQLDWHNCIHEAVDIDGAAVRQVALNLLLNACAASPSGGRVSVTATCSEGLLRIGISDEGPGLPKNLAALLDPDAPLPAPSGENKGLGLWTTGHLIRRLYGRATVEYPELGTRVVVTFPVASKERLDAAA